GGGADIISSAFRSTMLQEAATDDMRGRMQGVFIVVVAGGPRLADILHGTIAEATRSEEHTSELQSRFDLVCRLLLEKKKLKYGELADNSKDKKTQDAEGKLSAGGDKTSEITGVPEICYLGDEVVSDKERDKLSARVQ